MNSTNGKYVVRFEEGGTAWKSYTNDIEEAQSYAENKAVVSDHPIIIEDNTKNLVLYTI